MIVEEDETKKAKEKEKRRRTQEAAARVQEKSAIPAVNSQRKKETYI